MIQANELRIGNYIVFEDCVYAWDILDETIQNALDNGVYARGISKIDEIRSYDVMSNGKLYPFNNVYPIPLTEKILLKCGFEKSENYFYIKCTDFIFVRILVNFEVQICITNIKESQGNNIQVLNVENMRNIKSVHQLQNLYFILNNKELEINE